MKTTIFITLAFILLAPMAQSQESLSNQSPRARLEKYLRTLSPDERAKVLEKLNEKRKIRLNEDKQFLNIATPVPDESYIRSEIGEPEIVNPIPTPTPRPRPTPSELQDYELPPGPDPTIYKPASAEDQWRPELLWRPVLLRHGPGVNFTSHKYQLATDSLIKYDVSGRGFHYDVGVEFPLGKVFLLDLGTGIGVDFGQGTGSTDDTLASFDNVSFLFTRFDLGFLYTPRGTSSGIGPFLQTSYTPDSWLPLMNDNKIVADQALKFLPGFKLRIGFFGDYAAQFDITREFYGLTFFFIIPLDEGMKPNEIEQAPKEIEAPTDQSESLPNLQ